eukprot:2985576-Amphidinium_carterae.1
MRQRSQTHGNEALERFQLGFFLQRFVSINYVHLLLRLLSQEASTKRRTCEKLVECREANSNRRQLKVTASRHLAIYYLYIDQPATNNDISKIK